MRVLIVDDEGDLRELLAFFCQGQGFSDVVFAESGKEASKVFDQNADIGLILSDYNMPEGNGGEFWTHVQASGRKPLFILFSARTLGELPEFQAQAPFAFFSKPPNWKELKGVLATAQARLAGAKQAQQASKGPDIFLEGYVRLGIHVLEWLNSAPSEMFLRLGAGNYIRFFQSGQTFVADDFNHLRSKKLDCVYVRKEDTPTVFRALSERAMRESPSPKVAAVLEVSQSALEVLYRLATQISMPEESQRVGRLALQQALDAILNIEEMRSRFDRYFLLEGDYLSSHSIASAQLTAALAHRWIGGGAEEARAVALAACVHDLFLPSSNIAKIEGAEDFFLQRENFTEEESQAFLAHTQWAADALLKKYPNETIASRIIAEHHETSDGSGFPKGKAVKDIHELSALFIVVHDLVRSMMLDRDLTLERFVEKRGLVYQSGPFVVWMDRLQK